MPDYVEFEVELSGDLYERLERLADYEGLSVNDLRSRILKDSLDEYNEISNDDDY